MVRVYINQPEAALQTIAAIRALHLDIALIALLPANKVELARQARVAGARYCVRSDSFFTVVTELLMIVFQRRASVGHDQLQLLVNVAERMQRAQTFHDAAQVVVVAAAELGFARTRLWLLSEDWQWIHGACQHGDPSLVGFEEYKIPVVESHYTQRVLHLREPVIFHGQELGPWVLSRQFAEGGFLPPHGEWVHMPLWSGPRCWGILSLDNGAAPSFISREQRTMLDLFARQVAAALERAHLQEHERRQRAARDWLEALDDLTMAMQGAMDAEAVARIVVRGASRLGFRRSRLWLLSKDRSRLHCVAQEGESTVEGIVGFELEMTDAVYARHLLDDPQPRVFTGRSEEMAHLDKALAARGFQPPAGEWASLPLWSSDAPLGLLVLDRGSDPHPLDVEQRTLLKLLNRQVSVAIERVRLIKEEQQYSRARDWINELVEITNQHHDPSLDEVVQMIVRGARRLGFERARLWRLEGDEIVGVAQSDNQGLDNFVTIRFALAELPYSCRVLEAREPLFFDGRIHGPSGLDLRFGPAGFEPPTGDWAEIPIQTSKGIWGLLTLDNIRQSRSLTETEQALVRHFANQAGAAIQRTQDLRRLTSREQELHRISELMTWVLEATITAQGAEADFERLEYEFARNLLSAAASLLGQTDVSAGLMLRKYVVAAQGHRGRQSYRYFWEEHGELRYDDRQKDLDHGISSVALREGVSQRAADIRLEPWRSLFVPGNARDTLSELDVPITIEGGYAIGVINLESPQANTFTADHQAIMERLARVTGLAFGNLQRQRFLHATLAAVTRLSEAAGREQCRQAIIDALLNLNPDLAALMVWEVRSDEEVDLELVVMHKVYNANRRRLEDDGSLLAAREILAAPTGLWFPYTETIPLPRLQWLCKIQGLRSAVALPLVANDDRRLGALLLGYREQREFTIEERTMFPVVAATVATSLRDVRRLADLEAREDHLQAALKIAGAVGISQRREEILAAILKALKQIYPDDQIFVSLFDEPTARLRLIPECKEYYQITDKNRLDPAGLALDDVSISCFLARQFERSAQPEIRALNVVNVQECTAYLPLVATTRSQLTAVLADGPTLLGVIGIESPHLNAFDENDERAIEEVSRQISQAIMRAQQGARLRRTLLVSARTAWAALLAHDINRGIGSIRNQAFMARRAGPLPPKAEEHLRQIDLHAKRLAGTMDMVEQESEEGMASFPLNNWLAREIPVMLVSDDYTLTIQPLSGEFQVRLHVFLLRTALLLLVRNAREAMGAAGQLTLRTRHDGHMVEIEVEDSGPGVPEQIRRYLFDEPGSTKEDGGGLGLIFVRLLIEEIGGSVRLQPQEPGRGAVFVLRLPINDPLIRGGEA